jgi:hypothetical protein
MKHEGPQESTNLPCPRPVETCPYPMPLSSKLSHPLSFFGWNIIITDVVIIKIIINIISVIMIQYFSVAWISIVFKLFV